VAVKSTGDISAEPVTGQNTEEHVLSDLDVRNDKNRPSLTSDAVAEERQAVLSRNTIDELADAITGDKDIGLWSSKIAYRKKCGNIARKTKSYFLNIMFHNTETRHGNATQILLVARTTTSKSLKEAGFDFLLHKFVLIVPRVD